MMNKKFLIFAMLLAVLALPACDVLPTPATNPTEVVEPTQSSAPAFSNGVIASAEVVPAKSVELGFAMIGMVTAVEVEVGDTVRADQLIAGLDTTILEASVAEAEANVLAAESQVQYLDRVGTSQEQLDKAQADVDRAKAFVEQAKANLTQATLYSPVAGTVISLEISTGEVVTPGQVVIVIADLTKMRVETTDLSERDILSVQKGQQVNVFIEALDDNFEGRVIDIARRSLTVGGDVVYTVTIELDQQPEGLRWGMSAEVEIQTEQ